MLYTLSDTWKKYILGDVGFSLGTLIKPIFLVATSIALIGFVFQMYALSKMDLSRTIVGLGMLAVLFSTAAGVFFFREQLNAWNYLGLGLALVAIMLVNVK